MFMIPTTTSKTLKNTSALMTLEKQVVGLILQTGVLIQIIPRRLKGNGN
jgi:hypothetical protein